MRLLNDCLKLCKGKTLLEERNDLVIRYLFGRVLDIGCGLENYIGKHYRNCIPCDIWNLLGNGALPFPNDSFDCVTMVASINYMDRFSRERYFREVRRVLRDNGLFIITCTNKVGGFLKAFVESDGEKDLGLSRKYIVGLAVKNKYDVFHTKRFNFCLNNLFIFQKGSIENSPY